MIALFMKGLCANLRSLDSVYDLFLCHCVF
jgi:hypothetical protein